MNREKKSPRVLVLMGSDSDLTVLAEAADVLEELGVEAVVSIASAHRTPERLFELVRGAHQRGIEVIIAGAGGAAHLPGVIAALSPLPVIGVPVRSSTSIDGWDSILSILQMPPGVPVATVGLNGGRNAGILAAQMLSVADPALRERIVRYRDSLRQSVEERAKALESTGHKEYLRRQKKE